MSACRSYADFEGVILYIGNYMGDLEVGLSTAVPVDGTIMAVAGVGVGLILVLMVWNIVLTRQVKGLKESWGKLSDEVDGGNLEKLMQEHLRQNVQIETNIEEILKRLSTVEDRMRASKRYLGVVRYDAFEEVGGEQSFAMAIYDDDGNGAVITSQVGRHDNRVYGKPLFNGKSDLSLTVEEQRAIEKAASPNSRPRISP